MANFRVKRGDAFALRCVAANDGAPLNIAEVTIRAQMRYQGRIASNFSVEILDAPNGIFVLHPVVPTSAWPVARMLVDIEYEITDVLLHTETFTIECLLPQTRPL